MTVNPDGTVSYDPSTSATIQGAAAGSILTDTFTYTASSLTGQLSTTTVTVTVADGNIVDYAGGKLSIRSGPATDSSMSSSYDGTNFTISDSAATFSLTQAAIDAGFTGAGTNTIIGPAAAVSEFSLDLGDGNDTLTDFDAGAAILSVKSSGILNVGGTVTTTATINVNAPDVASTASGHLIAPTVNLTATNSLGAAGSDVQTQADTLSIAINGGDAFVTEADGATVTATATGSGNLSINNLVGTLTVGDVSAANGNISLSSGDAITLAADVSTGGTISIAANTDGAGNEGLSQTAGTISTSDVSANAATITVNTNAGGTGDAVIDSTSIGSASGGTLSINSNGGSILYAGTGSLERFPARRDWQRRLRAGPRSPGRQLCLHR